MDPDPRRLAAAMSTVLAAVDDTPAARCVLATAQAVSQALHRDTRALHVGESPGHAAEYAQEYGLPLLVVARPTRRPDHRGR